MNNFKNLKIWQKGLDIAIKTYQALNDFPKEERFGLVSQLTRSTVSILSNIAEGCSRSSNKD